jgi:DNA ligase D-like protein (predicted ligase)
MATRRRAPVRLAAKARTSARAAAKPPEPVAVRGRRIPAGTVRGWVEPMLATLVSELPDAGPWVFERKLDGYRALAFRDGANVRLFSRNKLPLEESFPTIAEAVAKLARKRFVIDGEIVAVVAGDAGGFQQLQQRTARTPVRYYVFDLLSLDGGDVRALPLRERRRLLRDLGLSGRLRRTATLTGDAEALLARACASGWEGLIAKRAEAHYRGGRSRDWLKLKCSNEQELVIGGFTEPKGSRTGFGALMVGYHEGGALRFAGEVGTGFNERMLRELSEKLRRLETAASPFADHPKARKGQHFARPKLIAQVGFSEWTRDGKLRHPRFLGLRTDKRPEDVVRERPSP